MELQQWWNGNNPFHPPNKTQQQSQLGESDETLKNLLLLHQLDHRPLGPADVVLQLLRAAVAIARLRYRQPLHHAEAIQQVRDLPIVRSLVDFHRVGLHIVAGV